MSSSSDIPADLAERKAAIKDTLRCPYCDTKLEKYDVSEWIGKDGRIFLATVDGILYALD